MADPTSGTPTSDATTAELLRQLSEQSSRLVSQEVELAKADLATKGKQAGIGAGMFGGAGSWPVLPPSRGYSARKRWNRRYRRCHKRVSNP